MQTRFRQSQNVTLAGGGGGGGGGGRIGSVSPATQQRVGRMLRPSVATVSIRPFAMRARRDVLPPGGRDGRRFFQRDSGGHPGSHFPLASASTEHGGGKGPIPSARRSQPETRQNAICKSVAHQRIRAHHPVSQEILSPARQLADRGSLLPLVPDRRFAAHTHSAG